MTRDELDRFVIAYRENPTDENRAALMAAQQEYFDGFMRREADECLARVTRGR